MKLAEALADEDAVSPIIGVVLMVAVTVILAAVIAAFVFGFGDEGDVPPQVSFEYEYDFDRNLTITVQSGDAFDSDRVTFRGDGLGDDTDQSWTAVDERLSEGTRISAGDSVTLDDIEYPSFELDIVWTAGDGSRSTIIATTSGPTP